MDRAPPNHHDRRLGDLGRCVGVLVFGGFLDPPQLVVTRARSTDVPFMLPGG